MRYKPVFLPFRSALEKLHTQTLLKVAQRVTNRRRRHAKAFCRLHETPLFVYGKKNRICG